MFQLVFPLEAHDTAPEFPVPLPLPIHPLADDLFNPPATFFEPLPNPGGGPRDVLLIGAPHSSAAVAFCCTDDVSDQLKIIYVNINVC